MKEHASTLFVAVGLVAMLGVAAAQGRASEPVALEDAVMRVEVNSTDQDAGFQVFLDGEGWKKVSVRGPDRRPILNVRVGGGVKWIGGGTELFLETAEPEYEDLGELQDLLDFLPEGDYEFFGRTVEENLKLVGTAELTHVVPAGPVITAPSSASDDECAEGVPANAAIVSWEPVTTDIFGSSDIEIVGYQVIVEDEESGRSFQVDLPADATQVTVSPEVLEPDTEYKFEILAIEESDNQTITESCFITQ